MANFWIIKSNRRERDEDVAVVSNPERILRDGGRITTAWSTSNPVGDPPIAPQSLEAALEEVAAPTQRTEGEDSFDGSDIKPVPGERPPRGLGPVCLAYQSGRKIQYAIRSQVARP